MMNTVEVIGGVDDDWGLRANGGRGTPGDGVVRGTREGGEELGMREKCYILGLASGGREKQG